MPSIRRAAVVLSLLAFALGVAAHEHHEVETGPYEQNFTNEEPLDTVIKWHIGIQIFCWGILFPVGMVLGITRSRFHVPLQTLTIVLTLAGNFLGHHHGGRGFHMTAHAHFAGYLWWYLIMQTAFGVFLKLHVMEGTKVRRGVVIAHGIVGKSFPVVGWVQMIFGGIASLGFCFGEHFGQCLAHFIMGSAFIGYAMILLLMLRVGAGFLARKKMSQEYLDSWVIMLWGIVNTFTEHNFFPSSATASWSHKDMQHVSLGVLWWAGGALGVWMGRNAKRNVMPAIIIAMTGFAMANHGQALEFSTSVHKLFGASLMAAGGARIIEICFVLKDEPTPPTSAHQGPRAFQHLTPFLLVLSGLTFLSATEEQMIWVAGSGMDSTTYANILFSGAFAIYLAGVAMVDLYQAEQRRREKAQDARERNADPEQGGSFGRGGGRGRSWIGMSLPAIAAGLLSNFPSPGQRPDGEERFSSAAGRANGHLRSDTADYESMPLTAGRESVDVGGGASGSGSGGSIESVALERRDGARARTEADRRTAGSEETVFEVGEYEDDGGDGYWEEKDAAVRRT
ncbi:hypothetical protein JCM1841_001067 [Sporobolomyces salmonicolor]